MYALLKKFLGWADDAPRKRRAPDNDIFSPPNAKKSRCCHHHHNNNNNNNNHHREILEVEDPINSFKQSQIYRNNLVRKPYNSQNHNRNLFKKSTSTPKSKDFLHSFKMGSCQSKVRRNSQLNIPQRTTLSKSNQLIQKQQYSEILQSYCTPKIQLIKPTPNGKICQQKQTEIIDVENYEPSTSNDIFKTPMGRTPTRYFTPMTRPSTSSSSFREKKTSNMTIPIIKVTDDEEEEEEEEEEQSTPSRLKKVVANRSVEIIPTNTLRDSLSAKKVLKPDYIPRSTEQFKESMEQRVREVEQLKRETELLASHNRHQRMASLEEQLARTMEHCKPFLEDDEEEEEDVLPELNQDMINVIKNSLIPRPDGQVLVDHFGLRITRKDIQTLSGLKWLNDEVINFYMNLLIERGKEDKYPNIHAMNTFFYPKLCSGGHSSLKRWTRKIDIFSMDLVVVPIHLGVHWCMSIINFRDKTIRYYDSMGGENRRCLVALKKYIEDESLDKKKVVYDTSDWTLENMKNIPQQMNGSDCGVFSCTFAEFICANRKIFFTQDDMPYFRQKMVYEIVSKKLL